MMDCEHKGRRAAVILGLLLLGGAMLFAGPASSQPVPQSEWVLLYPRGLAITNDSGPAGRIDEIQRTVSGWTSSASQEDRAMAYIRARYALPDADWQQVLAIARRAVLADPVILDVPSFAEEIAYVSLLLPDGEPAQWENVAWTFREVSSGRRFSLEEYQYVRDAAFLDDEVDPAATIGTIADFYRERGTLEGLKRLTVDKQEETE